MNLVSRRDLLALASGLGLAGFVAGCIGPEQPGTPGSTPSALAASASKPPPPATAATPVSVVIPAIGLDESVAALGLDSNGQIVPPNHTIQWYTASAKPGAPGIAVLAGHVTSPKPDVFYRLSELAPRDTFTVADRGGTQTRFRVTRVGRKTKEALTRDPTVWGTTTERTVVLVTCDLDSPTNDSHYEGNFIAWAVADSSL